MQQRRKEQQRQLLDPIEVMVCTCVWPCMCILPFMCMVYVHIQAHMHIYTHTYRYIGHACTTAYVIYTIHGHMHTYMRTCLHPNCIHKSTQTCIHTHMHHTYARFGRQASIQKHCRRMHTTKISCSQTMSDRVCLILAWVSLREYLQPSCGMPLQHTFTKLCAHT